MIITRMRMRTGGGVPVHAAHAAAAADKSGYDPTNEKRGIFAAFFANVARLNLLRTLCMLKGRVAVLR